MTCETPKVGVSAGTTNNNKTATKHNKTTTNAENIRVKAAEPMALEEDLIDEVDGAVLDELGQQLELRGLNVHLHNHKVVLLDGVGQKLAEIDGFHSDRVVAPLLVRRRDDVLHVGFLAPFRRCHRQPQRAVARRQRHRHKVDVFLARVLVRILGRGVERVDGERVLAGPWVHFEEPAAHRAHVLPRAAVNVKTTRILGEIDQAAQRDPLSFASGPIDDHRLSAVRNQHLLHQRALLACTPYARTIRSSTITVSKLKRTLEIHGLVKSVRGRAMACWW